MDRFRRHHRPDDDDDTPGSAAGADGDGDGMVDLTAAADDAAEEVTSRFGRPTACPRCGGAGYLDHVDVVDRVQHEHCPDCHHEWQVSEAELLAEA